MENEKGVVPKLFTYSQVAEMLGCSVMTLKRAVKSRRIGHIKIGPKQVRFTKDQILAYMKYVNPKNN